MVPAGSSPIRSIHSPVHSIEERWRVSILPLFSSAHRSPNEALPYSSVSASVFHASASVPQS